ncbi:hypothetical protein SDC9_128627 [bioreactor metagenome]|uniref:Acetolactate synthase n=1 Tax=bioreactor metagenome TaxID=1076179 RepID=A0A645CXG7_9ZZZZ
MKNLNGSYLVTMLTDDAALTLARFTGVLGRWGCALETLVISEDCTPGFNRLTCVFSSDPYQATRITSQTARLEQVTKLQLVSQSPLCDLSPLKVRISCNNLSHAEACRLCDRHNALISGRSDREMTIETESSPKGLAMFLNDVAPYGLLFAEVPNVSYFPLETEALVSGAC